jgi:hypothetical protein
MPLRNSLFPARQNRFEMRRLFLAGNDDAHCIIEPRISIELRNSPTSGVRPLGEQIIQHFGRFII